MAAAKFWINWSIDCEATQKAVGDADLGRRGAEGFAALLDEYGLKGNFFVIPGDAASAPGLYQSFVERGHEVGLHLHPGEEGGEEFAGVMGPEMLYDVLNRAKDRWTDAMGFEPVSFCMGYGSANDYTYQVLEKCNFKYGQVGIPGRRLAATASVWEGAPFTMHYAHRYNRLLPGDMEFVDVPHTIDPESYMWGGKHPQDLRVELVDAKNHWYTVHKSVLRQKDNDTVPVKVVRAVTHNTFDYSDPRNFRRETMIGMIEGIRRIIEDAACEMTAGTLSEIVAEYRRIVPRVSAGLTLDRRGYGGKKTV